MGVKKNKNLKKQRIIVLVIIVLIVLIIIFGAIFAYLYSQNYITVTPTSLLDKAEQVENSDINNADVIILNNVLLGGVNNNKWISANKMYERLIAEKSTEINMYSADGNLGRFDTASFKYNGDFYYTTTTKVPTPEEYIAVGNTSTEPKYMMLDEFEPTEFDIKNVKKILGKYNFLNGTVNIVECYRTSFSNAELGTIYSVTSAGANIFGVYSAVIFSKGKESCLIKYSYVKDTELSSAWPVYDIKHVVDINGDGKCELILQETTASKINYLVEEYIDNGEFNEVLKVTIDI